MKGFVKTHCSGVYTAQKEGTEKIAVPRVFWEQYWLPPGDLDGIFTLCGRTTKPMSGVQVDRSSRTSPDWDTVIRF